MISGRRAVEDAAKETFNLINRIKWNRLIDLNPLLLWYTYMFTISSSGDNISSESTSLCWLGGVTYATAFFSVLLHFPPRHFFLSSSLSLLFQLSILDGKLVCRWLDIIFPPPTNNLSIPRVEDFLYKCVVDIVNNCTTCHVITKVEVVHASIFESSP